MGNTLTIFDLDNTLIQGDSSTVWSQFMVREGLATQKGYLAREARLMADYDRGEMNIADYVALIQAPLAGIPKSDVDALVARCVREAILPRVYPQAWELIRRLRAEGEQMLIISASVSLLVQAVAAALEIETICPLHGPVLTGGALAEALRLYDLWSRWQSEAPEEILLAHASIHGNTARAAELLKQKLEAKGARVTLCDLTTTEVSYAVANAFYCGKLVLACSTYDGGLFPPMEEFLSHLQAKGFRDRSVGLMENGSWAPAAARLMRAKLEEMKDLRVCGTVVSLRSALSPASEAQMDALSAELCAK